MKTEEAKKLETVGNKNVSYANMSCYKHFGVICCLLRPGHGRPCKKNFPVNQLDNRAKFRCSYGLMSGPKNIGTM